jgi:hypothetical protein
MPYTHSLPGAIVHRPDLALYDTAAKVGLGLWTRRRALGRGERLPPFRQSASIGAEFPVFSRVQGRHRFLLLTAGKELSMHRARVVAPVVVTLLLPLTACRSAPQSSATPSADAPAAAAAPATGEAAPPPMMTAHGSVETPTTVEPMAAPPGGLSVANVFAQRKTLAGKPVTVRGKVVKANNGILGRNWIHIQDGSGSAADRSNDLTVTSDAVVKVGDIVTFAGILGVGVEIGEGYGYDALLEKAKVVK